MKKHLTKIFIVLLLILSLIYFGKFLFNSRIIGGQGVSDFLKGGYAKRSWLFEKLKNFNIPEWNNAMFSGFSMLTSSPSKVFSPLRLLGTTMSTRDLYTLSFILYTFLAGLGAYLVLREFKVPKYASFFLAISYMFAGKLASTTYAGHVGRLSAAAVLPIVFYFMLKALHKRKFLYFALFSLVAGASFYVAHTQILYYGYLFLAAYFIFYVINILREKGLKDSLRMTGYGIISVALVFCIIATSALPTITGLGQGARGGEKGYDYATSWSKPGLEVANFINPYFSGIKDNYWGSNYFKLHTEYFGLLPLLLAGLGAFLAWRKREVKFFAGGFVLLLLFAVGDSTPFFRIYYHLIPMVSKFRGASMMVFVLTFNAIILAGFGMKELARLKRKGKTKKLTLILLSVIGGFLLIWLIFVLGEQGILNSLQNHIRKSVGRQGMVQKKIRNLNRNYSNLQQGFLFAFLFIFAFAGALILYIKKKIKLIHLALIFIPLIVLDTWRIDKKFLESVPSPDRYYAKDEVIKFLEKDDSLYRVFAFPKHYEDGSAKLFMLNNIQDIGGAGPNPPARYQDYIGAGSSVMFRPNNLITHRKMLNLLNVKYIVARNIPENLSRYNRRNRSRLKKLKDYFSSFQTAYRGRRHTVYKNPYAVPRAFLVPNYKVYKDKSRVLSRLKERSYNPRKTVLLEKKPESGHFSSSDTIPGEVEITDYNTDKIELKGDIKSECFLVISGNHHPDWKAYVDGKETEVHIANYTLRAIHVPKGEHKITLKYKSKAYQVGGYLSIFGLLFIAGYIAVWRYREKNKEE